MKSCQCEVEQTVTKNLFQKVKGFAHVIWSTLHIPFFSPSHLLMNPTGGMTTAAGHAAMAAVAAAAAAAAAGSTAPPGALSVGSASGIAVRRTAHSGISDTWKRLDDMLGTVCFFLLIFFIFYCFASVHLRSILTFIPL
jgi:hypothetical protein